MTAARWVTGARDEVDVLKAMLTMSPLDAAALERA